MARREMAGGFAGRAGESSAAGERGCGYLPSRAPGYRRDLKDLQPQGVWRESEMLGDLIVRESRCHPNTHEPLPRRQAREDCGGYIDLSLVWVAATVPDHELIGSKWCAAAEASRSPGAGPRKAASGAGVWCAGAVSLETRQGSFYPRGSRLPGSLPDCIALNSR